MCRGRSLGVRMVMPQSEVQPARGHDPQQNVAESETGQKKNGAHTETCQLTQGFEQAAAPLLPVEVQERRHGCGRAAPEETLESEKVIAEDNRRNEAHDPDDICSQNNAGLARCYEEVLRRVLEGYNDGAERQHGEYASGLHVAGIVEDRDDQRPE